ncbi:MAG: cytochrome ubiquinol oxidase subunit I [Thermoguttaceae bacterium]
MQYPWWYVPHLTAPMLIAVISVVHVLVSHYAVGGGLFLAVETAHAHKTGDRPYLDYLRGHARFFILLTVVFGAITGVGIWWTIGLTSPLATETLIRTFVFGWATEWVFFVVEIVSAFIFLYYWDRLPTRTHTIVGWIYAIAAYISLVLITGITAFMLNSGTWATRPGDDTFWMAFFNPQFLPQTVARTGGALLLSSLYVYLHASFFARDERLRNMIAARSARPALLGAILITAGGIAWYCQLPPSAAATLQSAAVLNLLTALIFALTIIVFFLIYVGPYRNPGWLSPGFAGSLCLFGIAAFSTGEFIRESIRKPFVVHNVVLGNQIAPTEVLTLKKSGFLQGGLWTRAFVKEHYPDVFSDRAIPPWHIVKMNPDTQRRDAAGPSPMAARNALAAGIQNERLLALPYKDRLKLGNVLFLHHCNDCHAADIGYSAVGPLLQGRPRDQVLARVERLDDNYFMPPWSGSHEEAILITDYLMTINPARPVGVRHFMKEQDQSREEDTE